MFNPPELANPPRYKDLRSAMNGLLDLMMADLFDKADEAEKPILKAPMNMKRVKETLNNAFEIVHKSLDNPDRSVTRECASRFNAMVEPIIETVEQFVAENAKGEKDYAVSE